MATMQKEHPKRQPVYEPTRQAIRWACERIQVTWSPRERARRTRRASWQLPLIRLCEMAEPLAAEQLDTPGSCEWTS